MIRSFLKFARVRIIVTSYALAFLGSAASGDITPETFLTIFIIAASIVHGNSINDFADHDIDKINLKHASDRPLVSKDISHGQLLFLHIICGLSALMLSWLYGSAAVFLTLAVLVFNYIYSLKPIRLTDRTLLGPATLSLAYTYYPFSLGVWSVSDTANYPVMLSIGLYLGFIARILLKDFRDIKGDKAFGKITFRLRYGAAVTCITSGALWLTALLVVAASVSFDPAFTAVLFLGFVFAAIMLSTLSRSKDIKTQEGIIIFIAKTANLTIIAMLAYFLCLQQSGLSDSEINSITLLIGSVLLVLNFLRYKTWTARSL